MTNSNFTIDGLPIGAGDRNMTYLYGVSDFWSSLFEDSDKINLFYEASSHKLSEIYSHFLQLCSTISLEDIQVYSKKQLSLVLLGDSAAVQGKVNTYTLPAEVISAEGIANRPLLPTVFLEKNVHFSISEDGSEISFSSSLANLGFPSRILASGERQFALWFIDVEIDKQFIYNYFGKILFADAPDKSTEAYKNFIYGLHYLFINGPDLATLKKGLNIALGIPLARDTETVLETRKYLNTDQYLVVTDLNSYLIPYGLTPTVAVDDVLEPTQELAEWVEVKDYRQDGEWWINLQIPPAVLPYIPAGEPDRYAKAGSYADYLMRNYLKTHTFLVNVKTIDFKNLQTFTQLFSIINEAKPSYTTPIYIWTVPTGSETLVLNDDTISHIRTQFKCENLTKPIGKMNRKLVRYAKLVTPSDISGIGIHAENTITWKASWNSLRSDTPLTSGKWYWEVTNVPLYDVPSNNWHLQPRYAMFLGVGTITAPLAGEIGASSEGYSWTFYSPNLRDSKPDSAIYQVIGGAYSKIRNNNLDLIGSYGFQPTINDVLGVMFDADTRQLFFYINGISLGLAATLPPGVYYPMVGTWDSYIKTTVNLGKTRFFYPPSDRTINLGVYTQRFSRVYADFSYDKHPSIILDPVNKKLTGTIESFVTARASLPGVTAAPEMGKSTGTYWTEFTFSTTNVSGEFAWAIGVGRSTDSLATMVGTNANSVSLLGVKSGVTGMLSSFGGFAGDKVYQSNTVLQTRSVTNHPYATTAGDRINMRVNAASGLVALFKNDVLVYYGAIAGAGPLYLEVSVFKDTTVTYNVGESPFVSVSTDHATVGWYADSGSDDRLTRGCPQFLRCNTSWKIYGQLGNDPEMNALPRNFDNGVIEGYVGSDNQFQDGRDLEVREWVSALMTRDSETFGKTRSYMAFNRNNTSDIVGVSTFLQGGGLKRKVLLHLTTQAELSERMSLVGQTVPGLETWEWAMFASVYQTGEVLNTQPVNTSQTTSYYNYLILNYSSIFFRTGSPYLGHFVPADTGYETYAPAVGEIMDGDYLWCVRISENTIGVFWITSNLAASSPNVRAVKENDSAALTMRNAPLLRGAGMYSPYYNVRGGGTNAPGETMAVNTQPLNESIDSGSKIDVYYTDNKNPTPLLMDRSGILLNIGREFS